MDHSAASFHIILIKPTHYNAEGYPIQWRQNWIVSNSLACIYALAMDCNFRKVLGPEVTIEVHAMDEITQRIPVKELLRLVQKDGGRALVCLVGVQTNQFPRAMDISVPFLAAGLPVIAGGIHVSGCIAMLKELPADLRQAQAQGICFFAGEAEDGRFELVVRDAYAGKLRPVYNFLDRPPELQGQPIPILPKEILARSSWFRMSSFDMGRGCPFDCSFCTIINVHGRKSRFRSADELERIIMENNRLGVSQFFVTDDNLARNKNWEELFDRLIELREKRGIAISMLIQVDTQAHRIPGFIDKAARAGIDQVFMGLESVNPDNLAGAGKHQNHIEEFREMMLEWKRHPVVIIGAYIIGFPNDTPESIKRDVEFLKRELPIDIVYFSLMQPLPGSKDHQVLSEKHVWMDPDMNKYDTTHPVMEHPHMTASELEEAYLDAWRIYYTIPHMDTIFRRMFALKSNKTLATVTLLYWFSYFYAYMGIHPIDGGCHPIRKRNDRRPTLPLENPLLFYPRNLYRIIHHYITMNVHFMRIRRLMLKVKNDPGNSAYRDSAIAPAFEQKPK